ncbi:MAG: ubiquinone biosynthesis regulatory protein kinase UbiB [Gammaproteobacteria bacterium]
MASFKQRPRLFRLVKINHVLAKHGLDNVILSIRLLAPLRFLKYFNPWNWFRKEALNRGEAIRYALEDLGPIFVKFGQTLSMRRDLMPEDIANELTKLQDNVPPFSSELAKKIIEKEFRKPISELFLEFEEQPFASASIAQIHAAKLHDGTEVVVKILRPGIEKIIYQDLSLLHTIARLAKRYWYATRNFHPQQIVQEFEKTIFNELDLMREAANASQLKRNFKDSEILHVPEIYWPYCREKIIVMERIYGIPIADIDTLKAYGVDMKILAERCVEIFFTQAFRDSFFHADMHPGNIFINHKKVRDPQIILVDFGIMGGLTEEDKYYLTQNMLAFFERDYRLVAKLHVECGWLPQDTRIDEFESAIRTVCEPIFEKPLQEMSCAQLIMRLFQCGRRFNMEIQPQLILLQKTLFAIEGLVRSLYPQLDMWTTAQPFLVTSLKASLDPKKMLKGIRAGIPFWTRQFPELPVLLYDVLKEVKQQKFTLAVKPVIATIAVKPTRRSRRGFIYGLGAALLLIPIVNIISKHEQIEKFIHAENLSIGLSVAGILILLITWLNK